MHVQKEVESLLGRLDPENQLYDGPYRGYQPGLHREAHYSGKGF